MASAVEALDMAASRLDDVLDATKAAEHALDGISDPLVDRVHEVQVKAEDVRSSVARARDALDSAGA
jgi:hypothetical protein